MRVGKIYEIKKLKAKISHHLLKICKIRIFENYCLHTNHSAQNGIAAADDGNGEKAINVQQLSARVLQRKDIQHN